MLTRRRLIAISAAMALTPGMARARPVPRIWTGRALGARASIHLDHPDAPAIARRVLAEIDRLENILSLYRPESALVRLNRDGMLDLPPFELLECLSLAGQVHRASGGVFDPTVQPLWALWAEAAVAGTRPDTAALAAVPTGWDRVVLDPSRITMAPGMALTLNGIGQGYVADRVAALLRAEGLDEVLVDTGEHHALGGQPGGGDWQVKLISGDEVGLNNRALATSAPKGTTFDQAGQDGHILDPRTGQPTGAPWQSVTISAPGAALADALTTAACLLPDHAAIAGMLGQFADCRLEAAV